jgi:hypothetical protein
MGQRSSRCVHRAAGQFEARYVLDPAVMPRGRNRKRPLQVERTPVDCCPKCGLRRPSTPETALNVESTRVRVCACADQPWHVRRT